MGVFTELIWLGVSFEDAWSRWGGVGGAGGAGREPGQAAARRRAVAAPFGYSAIRMWRAAGAGRATLLPGYVPLVGAPLLPVSLSPVARLPALRNDSVYSFFFWCMSSVRRLVLWVSRVRGSSRHGCMLMLHATGPRTLGSSLPSLTSPHRTLPAFLLTLL